MPSRRSQIKATKEREERKKRQEKFRKRTRSLFNKTKLLAKDTDAWVALVVRDRAGRVQSFRSLDSLYWPLSIQDLMTTHPSGTHEFLKKHAISGCWKEVTEDESDTGLVDGDAESDDEGVPAISVIPVEKEAESDSTISVDQCHVSEDVEDGANAPRDKPNETVAEMDDATVDAARESENPTPGKDTALDSGMLDDTLFEFGELDNMTIDAIEQSNNTTTGIAVGSDIVPDAPDEAMAMDILGTAEPDPTTLEYDMMELDIPGAKSRAQQDAREGDSIEAANALYTMSQNHNPPSSGGLGSWQVVNWPKMDPKELLQSWNWVFQNRYHQ